jgi:rRNA-processing protein FCF1
MRQVIFDSSFLMAVVESPTTWFEDIVDAIGKFQPVLPDCVEAELGKIASGQGKKARSARVSLELAAKFARTRCGSARVDDEIVSTSLSKGAAVATVDTDLKRSLRAVHAKVISLRRGRVSVS